MVSSILLLAFVIVSCSEESGKAATNTMSSGKGDSSEMTVALVDLTPKVGTNRWYTVSQKEEGQAIFSQYCASCHGKKAESVDTWRKVDDNGNYPPPPLNGSAHAWHHPLATLDMVIHDGGAPLGGVMPAWGEILTEGQRLQAIASFQDYWTDETYAMWLEREKSSRE